MNRRLRLLDSLDVWFFVSCGLFLSPELFGLIIFSETWMCANSFFGLSKFGFEFMLNLQFSKSTLKLVYLRLCWSMIDEFSFGMAFTKRNFG